MNCPGFCYVNGKPEMYHVDYTTKAHIEEYKKVAIISYTKAYVKCDRCGKDLEHWDQNTQVVYCDRCGGKFCLECWVEQRKIEDRTGNEYQS